MVMIIANVRLGRWLWLFPFWLSLVVRADNCWVCGKDSVEIVIMTDEVTQGKRYLCTACSKLKTVCALCGLPTKYKLTELPDGRVFCERDAKSVVIDEEQAKGICTEASGELQRLFSRFTTFPETNLTVEIVDRLRMNQILTKPGFDRQCPSVYGYILSRVAPGGQWKHPITILNGVPRGRLIAVFGHECAHAWVRENVPPTRDMERQAEEGFCELIGYRLAEFFKQEEELKLIKDNRYTEGQFALFLEADNAYGFYTVLQWMKWGTDHKLLEEEPDRIRHIAEKLPRTAPAANPIPIVIGPTPVPDKVTLIGILGTGSRKLALINDCSLGIGESGRVRYANTNATVRCVEIRTNSVVVEIGGEKRREELVLKGS